MPNASTLQFLLTLAKGIASQFGPNCEVVVHDLSQHPDHTIVAIENGHVSGRKVGDGASNVVLERMEHQDREAQDHLSYLTRTPDGKVLKSSTIYIRNSRGNPFTKNSFQTLLKNRRYLGEYRYKDTVIPNAIPAIIGPDCFDAVQRRCEIHRQAPAHNKADVHYLLTTKLFCGKCGTMMAGESGRSHTGTVHCYYKCGTRKRSGKEACSLKPVRKEPLEQFVVKTALEKVLNDRVIDMLADKLLEYQNKENTRLPVLQTELKEVKRRIDNLVAAIEQGILTPATKARMEELEQQREALETSILQEQIEKPPITREQILFWFDQFRHGDPADIAFQEKVIDCFVNSIYMFDDRIVVNFNYQEGGRPVSLEEVLSSFLDGNGAPQNTSHKAAGCFYFMLIYR